MKVVDLCQRHVVSVAPHESLDATIRLMEEHRIHHLPVVVDDMPVGMVSDRDLLLSVGWRLAAERHTGATRASVAGPTRVDEIMNRPVIQVGPEAGAGRAAQMMCEGRISSLPVVSCGTLVGMLTSGDLLRALAEGGLDDIGCRGLIDERVDAHMSTNLVKVKPKDTLAEVIRLFRERKIRHVPVVIDDLMQRPRLVGIVSDRDVRRALGEAVTCDEQAQESGGFYLGPTNVLDILTTHVRTIAPEDTLGAAIDEMLRHGIHALPVVENYELCGIVTETDVLRSIGSRAV